MLKLINVILIVLSVVVPFSCLFRISTILELYSNRVYNLKRENNSIASRMIEYQSIFVYDEFTIKTIIDHFHTHFHVDNENMWEILRLRGQFITIEKKLSCTDCYIGDLQKQFHQLKSDTSRLIELDKEYQKVKEDNELRQKLYDLQAENAKNHKVLLNLIKQRYYEFKQQTKQIGEGASVLLPSPVTESDVFVKNLATKSIPFCMEVLKDEDCDTSTKSEALKIINKIDSIINNNELVDLKQKNMDIRTELGGLNRHIDQRVNELDLR